MVVRFSQWVWHKVVQNVEIVKKMLNLLTNLILFSSLPSVAVVGAAYDFKGDVDIWYSRDLQHWHLD